MPLPKSFPAGTMFGIYDDAIPLSCDGESFAITAWDVRGGRPFPAELPGVNCELVSECEMVSEAKFRSFANAITRTIPWPTLIERR